MVCLFYYDSIVDHTKTKYLVMFDTKWATGIDYVKAIFASLSNK